MGSSLNITVFLIKVIAFIELNMPQDVTYNSARTTRKNLYECFYVAALRLDSMAATLDTFPDNLKIAVGNCAGAAAARSREPIQ